MSHRGTGNPSRRKSVFAPSINSNKSESSAQAIELERLEQEITLTLQDIDKSFAKSHKIINDKLIPIVKKYHNSSKKIWSGVNFWKTFLEASANVELRGYEEAIKTQDDLDNVNTDGIYQQQRGTSSSSNPEQSDETLKDLNEHMSPIKVGTSSAPRNHDNDVLMESTNHTQQHFQQRYNGNFNSNAVPEEAPATTMNSSTPNRLKENPIMPQVQKTSVGFDTTDSILPPIPVSANLSNTNGTDVNQTTPTLLRTNSESNHNNNAEDRHFIMHNNLDTTYKLQVSPKKYKTSRPAVNSVTPKRQPPSKKRKSMIAQRYDSSPFDIETPKLQSDVHFSPLKNTVVTENNGSPKERRKSNQRQSINQNDDNLTQRFPHTPRYGAGGDLLRTPAQIAQVANRFSNNFQDSTSNDSHTNKNNIDDSEEFPNISPPVTLNFATSQPNIRKTPAREAAHNIVKDLLHNVSGINDSTNQDSLFNESSNANDVGKGNILEDDFDAFIDDKSGQKQTGEEEWSDDVD